MSDKRVLSDASRRTPTALVGSFRVTREEG
jgi:hypothetical protein